MAISNPVDYSNKRHAKHYWHRWFAWHPVRLTTIGKIVWLRRIYRRALYHTYSTIDDWQRWEYGTIIDVLRSEPEPKHYRRD